ncbi:interleukin 12Ba precursor [Clinocottus analis]|uniref:interleukin 12Ba precursor n=1 Tax=Clinocottus analis TaxID=304258 RepID=UPI0035BFB65A
MKLFFGFVCAFLQVSHQNPTNQWTLMPHVLVVVQDGTLDQQPLSCLEQPGEDNKDEDISWRRNGEVESQRGNVYMLELMESLAGGNYTCHSKNGSLLNHTEVLIQDDETTKRRILVKTGQGDHLDCAAQNYNGEFHCSWTWHSRRVGKVAFLKARRVSHGDDTQCTGDESGQHWTCTSAQSNFGCSVDDSGHRISCLDQQHCPYAEESLQIYVTVYVKTEHFLVESYSKYFYLSEIVKPDKVAITQHPVNITTIEWSYPSSWSRPYSYFPLTFQIAQFRGRCKRCADQCTDSKPNKTAIVHSTCQFQVKPRAKAVCIRAKDVLCNSQWSDWSFVRLRRHKKNKHQQN